MPQIPTVGRAWLPLPNRHRTLRLELLAFLVAITGQSANDSRTLHASSKAFCECDVSALHALALRATYQHQHQQQK